MLEEKLSEHKVKLWRICECQGHGREEGTEGHRIRRRKEQEGEGVREGRSMRGKGQNQNNF